MRFNLAQLRTLLEVIELGSFSAAARRLHLTQPAVSLQIRELEGRCGVLLIERLGKRAFATAAGRELAEYARRIGDETERAFAAMRRYKDETAGRVRLGTGVTALTYLLPAVLRRLRERHPTIELVVTTGTTHSIVERMQENSVDIGLVTLLVDPAKFTVTPILEDPLLAIFPARGKRPPTKIKAADLAALPLILEHERSNASQLGRNWLRAAGIEGRPVMEIDNIEAVKSLVAAGLGVSIVSSAALADAGKRHPLVARPLDPPLERTLAIIRRRGKPTDPALEIVQEALSGLRREKRQRRSR